MGLKCERKKTINYLRGSTRNPHALLPAHLFRGMPRYFSDRKPPASTPYGSKEMPLAAQY